VLFSDVPFPLLVPFSLLTKDLDQLAVHDHLGLPQTPKKEKRLLPFTQNGEKSMDGFGKALPSTVPKFILSTGLFRMA